MAFGAAVIFARYIFDLTFKSSHLAPDMMGIFIGYTAALAKDVYGYYFGSSAPSGPGKAPQNPENA